MIQEFDLRNIVSSYSLNDCYIEHMEYENGLLKLYIDDILPETEAGYDDLEDFSNKYKSLIVTYKIINEEQSWVNVCKSRWFLKWPFSTDRTLELKDYVDYFKKVKKKKASIMEISHQYFANSLCLIEIMHWPMSNAAKDFCDLHLNVESITYEWREKSLDSLCKEIK